MGNHEVWKPESIMAPGLMNSASEPERPDLFESDGEKYDWYIHVLRSRIYEYNAARIDCLLGKEGGSGRFDNARTALNEVIEDPEVEVTDDQGNTTVVRRFLRPDFLEVQWSKPEMEGGLIVEFEVYWAPGYTPGIQENEFGDSGGGKLATDRVFICMGQVWNKGKSDHAPMMDKTGWALLKTHFDSLGVADVDATLSGENNSSKRLKVVIDFVGYLNREIIRTPGAAADEGEKIKAHIDRIVSLFQLRDVDFASDSFDGSGLPPGIAVSSRSRSVARKVVREEEDRDEKREFLRRELVNDLFTVFRPVGSSYG